VGTPTENNKEKSEEEAGRERMYFINVAVSRKQHHEYIIQNTS